MPPLSSCIFSVHVKGDEWIIFTLELFRSPKTGDPYTEQSIQLVTDVT